MSWVKFFCASSRPAASIAISRRGRGSIRKSCTEEYARVGTVCSRRPGRERAGVRATRCSSANRATTLKASPWIESDPARYNRVWASTSPEEISPRPLPRGLSVAGDRRLHRPFPPIVASILRTLPRPTTPAVADSPRRPVSRHSRRAQLTLPPLPRAAA